ncbi:MAG: hypothetical protein ABJN14_13540 [Paracoccaceae bacterium]
MDKKTYLVEPGFDVVNGMPVPANRRVKLTNGEAMFDLGLGRIRPLERKRAPKNPEPDGEEPEI